MTIYIATPITNRHEISWQGKYEGALRRVEMLKQIYADGIELGGKVLHPKWVSTFDVNAEDETNDARAMAKCIGLVLQCDAIYLDRGWKQSKGCNLEYRAAKIYGKDIIEHEYFL